MVGYNCLPPALTELLGLRNVRGYDAVDPARMLDLLDIAADPRSPKLEYAQTQWYMPKIAIAPPDYIRLSPILDMLGVRYVVFRGAPPPGLAPFLAGGDYWVLNNRLALPHVFVPERMEMIGNDQERLARLAASDFDPRKVAYVESPVELPDRCRGSAEIVEEVPTEITVSVNMQTRGLVVLSNLGTRDGTRLWMADPSGSFGQTMLSVASKSRLEERR